MGSVGILGLEEGLVELIGLHGCFASRMQLSYPLRATRVNSIPSRCYIFLHTNNPDNPNDP